MEVATDPKLPLAPQGLVQGTLALWPHIFTTVCHLLASDWTVDKGGGAQDHSKAFSRGEAPEDQYTGPQHLEYHKPNRTHWNEYM